jgi:glyoxalase family protein
MNPTTSGLHHVTAIASDPQRTAEFYAETLGLRLVKQTVNHDDPGSYHLYFGDGVGTPGTNITVFAWGEGGRPGEFGAGQIRTTDYLVDPGSVDYWVDRLGSLGIAVERTERFDETVLQFTDPDGIDLELVATDAPSNAEPWAESPVPEAHQLRGLYGVTLAVADRGPTAAVLTDVLGYERVAESGGRHRYRSGPGGPGSVVDLVETDPRYGTMGVGTVHHVAFSVEDVDAHYEWRRAFRDHGLEPTEVIDRAYFQSVYVREPGGVLFELATGEPGFTADEELADLGSSLVLPEWLADDRERIEARLPPFEPPGR